MYQQVRLCANLLWSDLERGAELSGNTLWGKAPPSTDSLHKEGS